jgi:hypothetical protein
VNRETGRKEKRGEEEGREKGEAKRYMLVQQEEVN